MKYTLKTTIKYFSWRYNQLVIVPEGYKSDGATGGIDIYSDAWWVHDKLKEDKTFFDGTPCTNWQASMILRDILKAEGRYIRAVVWFIATLFYGETLGRFNEKVFK